MKAKFLALFCAILMLSSVFVGCDASNNEETTPYEEETVPDESTTPASNETTTPEVVTTAPPPIETTTPERVTVAPPDAINPPHIIPNVDMSQIYEIYTGLTGKGHENIIKSAKSLGVEEGISNKTIQLDGKEYYLKYQGSYYSLRRDAVVEQYCVGDDSEKVVRLDKAGNIVQIAFRFKKLNITEKTMPMEILDILKEEFEETYHLSSYQYVYVPSASKYSTFHYDFTFYNMNNGFVTDSLSIVVRHTKEYSGVSSIKNFKCPVADAEFEIDPELEDAVIDLKLRKTYADDGYCGYEFASGNGQNEECRYLFRYNGKLYACYGTVAKLYEKQLGEIYSSYITDILIPIDMISKK